MVTPLCYSKSLSGLGETRYLTKANTQHISEIGTLLDGYEAHLSPRLRVLLTSSPVYGINGQRSRMRGTREELMSDIVLVKEALKSF